MYILTKEKLIELPNRRLKDSIKHVSMLQLRNLSISKIQSADLGLYCFSFNLDAGLLLKVIRGSTSFILVQKVKGICG
jgi:hypothetical protein